MEYKRQYLGEAIEQFLDWRRASRLSPDTIRNEKSILGRLARVSGPILIGSVTSAHAEAHWADAAKTKTSGLTVDYATLAVFFKWCRNTRRMRQDNDPLINIERPERDEKDRLRVPARDFPRLLAAAKHPRDRIFLALAIHLRLRSNEISRLRVGDVDLQAGMIRCQISKGRRGKVRIKDKPISAELDAELRRWLVYYQEQCGPLGPSWFLAPAKYGPSWANDPETGHFVRGTSPGDRLKPTICHLRKTEQMAQQVLVACGYPIRDPVTGKSNGEGMHTFRRSGATALYDLWVEQGEADADTLIMEDLNQKDLKMTLHYIGRPRGRKRLHNLIAGKVVFPVDDSNIVELGSRSRAMGD